MNCCGGGGLRKAMARGREPMGGRGHRGQAINVLKQQGSDESGSSFAPRKRKYSPIVWDLDEKQARSKLSSSSLYPAASAAPPPLVNNGRESVLVTESSGERESVDLHMQDQVRVSPDSDDVPEPGQLVPDSPMHEDEDDAPAPIAISASRWVRETHTPEPGKSPRGQLSSGGPQASGRDTSSEPGEYRQEKPDNTDGMRRRVKGTDSDGRIGKDCELDEDYYDKDDGEVQQPELDSDLEEPLSLPVLSQRRAIDMLIGCTSGDGFVTLNKIGEGAYGVVFRARNMKTREIVALKKVKMEKEREGYPMTSLREINVLSSFHHSSVVGLKEIVVENNLENDLDNIFMVMEYMEHDLKGLMESMKQPFSQSEVKCLMLQLFQGVKYLHDNWVLHRDLKTSNLLLNNSGELKICDFGLARQYGSLPSCYTPTVVTLWYRAPELLLGAKEYSTAIDMWSLGCIMAEFLAKEPLFNGQSEIDQIDKIFKTLGTPNDKIWPDYIKLPGVKCNFVRQPYNRLSEKFPPTAFCAGRPMLSKIGFDLLNRLLTYDPLKRITAEEALNHEWFREVPLPKAKEFMPTFPAQNEHDQRMSPSLKSHNCNFRHEQKGERYKRREQRM